MSFNFLKCSDLQSGDLSLNMNLMVCLCHVTNFHLHRFPFACFIFFWSELFMNRKRCVAHLSYFCS